MPGDVIQVIQTLHSGSGAQVEVFACVLNMHGAEERCPLQGSGGSSLVRLATGRYESDERADG